VKAITVGDEQVGEGNYKTLATSSDWNRNKLHIAVNLCC